MGSRQARCSSTTCHCCPTPPPACPPPQCPAPGPALVAVATWLRLSAMRLLTWNRNYNIKPREIATAQNTLAQRLASVADTMCVRPSWHSSWPLSSHRSLTRMFSTTGSPALYSKCSAGGQIRKNCDQDRAIKRASCIILRPMMGSLRAWPELLLVLRLVAPGRYLIPQHRGF